MTDFKLCPSKKKDLQQDSLFANLLAATLESPYLSTTKKEVTYCDHAYHHCKLCLHWILRSCHTNRNVNDCLVSYLDVAYKTKCGASGYPSKIR
jgi:hypothetical protein